MIAHFVVEPCPSGESRAVRLRVRDWHSICEPACCMSVHVNDTPWLAACTPTHLQRCSLALDFVQQQTLSPPRCCRSNAGLSSAPMSPRHGAPPAIYMQHDLTHRMFRARRAVEASNVLRTAFRWRVGVCPGLLCCGRRRDG